MDADRASVRLSVPGKRAFGIGMAAAVALVAGAATILVPGHASATPVSADPGIYKVRSGSHKPLPVTHPNGAVDQTMYVDSTVPANPAEKDPLAVELGVRFSVSQPGTVLGIRYYKSSANTGSHTGSLWSSDGTRLATATFVNEGRSGWQDVYFTNPVAVTPGQTYVGSYHTYTGYYATKTGVFSRNATIGNSYITGRSGIYHYGSTSAFPTDSWRDSAYFVDVMFHPGGTVGSGSPVSTPPTSTPPTSTPPTSTPPTSKPPVSTPPTSTPPAPPTSTPPTSTPPTSTPPTTQTKNCLSNPGACGFPDATTTGVPAGTTLKASGSITLTTNGQVVSGLNVTGCVTIKAANVTFRNSIVHSNGCRAAVYVMSGSSNVVVDHVEIDGTNSNTDGPDPGLYGWGWTATALNIHGTGDAVDIETGDVLTDSYIHNLRVLNGSHTDGVQATDGSSMTISHNTIIATGKDVNEGVIIGADLGNINGVTVKNNLIDGGNNGVVAGNNPGYTATNITFANNRFGTNAQYGPCNFNAKMTFTGNVWDASGAALSC